MAHQIECNHPVQCRSSVSTDSSRCSMCEQADSIRRLVTKLIELKAKNKWLKTKVTQFEKILNDLQKPAK